MAKRVLEEILDVRIVKALPTTDENENDFILLIKNEEDRPTEYPEAILNGNYEKFGVGIINIL